jgi:hypothetical protein
LQDLVASFRVNLLRGGIDPRHGFGQLRIGLIADRHRAEIGIFAVKAPFSWLVGMLESVKLSYVKNGDRWMPIE